MPIMEPKKLKECLNDFGCDENKKLNILSCNESNDIQGMIRLLRKHRQSTLDRIHKEEKQISCLDYFVFKLESEIET